MHELVCRLAEEQAASGAARGRLSGEVVEALRAAGLFKLYLPPGLGGLGLGLAEATSVIAGLSEADPAAGWAAMIGAGPNWFAGHMAPALADEVFGPADSCVAGSGKLGRATPEGDGWRIRGRWRWCSGAAWATWFTFNAVVGDTVAGDAVAEDAVALDAAAGGAAAGDAVTGDVEWFTFAVPAADVTLHPDTWDVRGLRATASWDVELCDVLVPAARTFRVQPDRPQRAEPIFTVPFGAFAQATMAAVSVGATRRALRLFAELAAHKTAQKTAQKTAEKTAHDTSSGAGLLAADRVVADRFARAVAEARAASDFLQRATAELGSDLPLAAAHAAATGCSVVRTLWDLSGMTVLAQDHPLGRTIADVQAAAQNAVVASARFADIGSTLLSPPV